MRRTLIALLAGTLLAATGACADKKKKKADDKASESTVSDKRGPPGKRALRGPAARARRLQNRLGLTDEQTAEVTAVFEADTTREEKQEALKGILTPEQFAEHEQMMGRRGGAGRRLGPDGRRGVRDPATRAKMLKERLGLTDEQTARVEAVFKEKITRDEQKEALKDILTPEQLERYEEITSWRRDRFGKRPRGTPPEK